MFSGSWDCHNRTQPIPKSVLEYWPFKLVGKLKFTVSVNVSGYCTAQLFRDGTLLTAAHCIYGRGQFRYNFEYEPVSGFPAQHLYIKKVCIRKQWITSEERDYSSDYAFLKLASPPKLNPKDEFYSTWSVDAVDKIAYAFGFPDKHPKQCVGNACVVFSKAVESGSKIILQPCNYMQSGSSGGVWGYFGEKGQMASSVTSHHYVSTAELGPILDADAKQLWEYTKTE